ncbi:hypothetical protein ACFQX7_14895 [Luedemannella flava]
MAARSASPQIASASRAVRSRASYAYPWISQVACGWAASRPSGWTIEFHESFQHWLTRPLSGLRVW